MPTPDASAAILTCHECRRRGTRDELLEAEQECRGGLGCILERSTTYAVREALMSAKRALESAVELIDRD